MRHSLTPARGLVWFRIAAVSVLVLLLGLSACSNANPSVAAYVDGTEIRQQQVDDAVAAIRPSLQEGQTVSPQALVNAMIFGVIADTIADQEGITITDAQRDTVLKTSNLASLMGVSGLRPVLDDVADQQIVAQRIGSAAFLQRVQQQQVTLNPRYGVLDPEQKIIIADESGSLARSASPTPEP